MMTAAGIYVFMSGCRRYSVLTFVVASKFGFGHHSWDIRPEWRSRYGKVLTFISFGVTAR